MNLYFKDVNATQNWNDPDHWFEDVDATVPFNGVPWVADDATKAYNLDRSIYSTEEIIVDAPIGFGFEITGECFIGVTGALNINNFIHSGTWSGDYITNNSTIVGGTFSGDNFLNNYNIDGGTFSGDNFTCDGGVILGGIFSGDNFTNNFSQIYAGTFSGENFSNNGGYIFGGTFSGINFNNNNEIYGGTFSGDNFSNTGGFIYGGIFSGSNSFNNSSIYGGAFIGNFFTNGSDIRGGIFSGEYFSNNGFALGGFWLESGSIDVDIFDFSDGGAIPTVSGIVRVTGNYGNPHPLDLSAGYGFMTLNVKGQDVLGTGLL